MTVRADRGAGSEVYAASFATFGDLIASLSFGGPGALSRIDILPGFSVRGFAYEFNVFPLPPNGVPAPGTGALLLLGGALLGLSRRGQAPSPRC